MSLVENMTSNLQDNGVLEKFTNVPRSVGKTTQTFEYDKSVLKTKAKLGRYKTKDKKINEKILLEKQNSTKQK